MKLTMHIQEATSWVSKTAGAITAGKAIQGLAVGVLLMAGTGMYFGISSGDD